VQSGGVLSLLLFNIYKEQCLEENPELLEAIKDGKFFAFADDLLLICDN
jgi:hypothetical protein